MNSFNNYNNPNPYQELNESSLKRLWEHNIKHDCGALTAFRKYNNCGYDSDGETCYESSGEPVLLTRKENQKRNLSLAADLKKLGYGITKIIGNYPEGGKVVKEVSYFVVNLENSKNFKQDLIKLGGKYNQDSILYIPQNAIENKSDEKAALYGTNDCCNNWLPKGNTEIFNKGKIGYNSPIYTSKINGRPFIFESAIITDEIFGSATTARLADKFSQDI